MIKRKKRSTKRKFQASYIDNCMVIIAIISLLSLAMFESCLQLRSASSEFR